MMKLHLCYWDVHVLADMKKDIKGPVLFSIHDSSIVLKIIPEF